MRVGTIRLARRLRQEGAGGLGPSLGAALVSVVEHGPLPPSALAEREGVSRPSCTRMVARLEAHGLLAREDDPADGRSCLLRATPAGVAHLDAVRSRKDAALARWIAALDEDDRAALDRAATVIERLLLEARA